MKPTYKKKKGVTIHDIADKLKISASTVSRALNDHPKINNKTKEKIWSTAKKMGYYPNIPIYMTKDSSQKVSIIVPELNHYYTEIINGAQAYFDKKSIILYISCLQGSNNIEKFLNESIKLGVKGVIISIFDKTLDGSQLYESIPNNFPLVLINKCEDDLPVSKIIPDVYNGAYKAVNHLYSMGCSKVGLFIGSQNSPIFSEMISAFESVSNILDKELDESLIYVSNFKQDDIAYGIDKLINQSNPPDGLLVGDQLAAQQIVSYLKSVGISVPQDMLIVSFGNEKFSSFVSPTLSSVQISGKNIGRMAAKQLYKSLIDQKKEPKTIVEQAKLIIKGSSMRLKS